MNCNKIRKIEIIYKDKIKNREKERVCDNNVHFEIHKIERNHNRNNTN
jgi:hypothetical protein